MKQGSILTQVEASSAVREKLGAAWTVGDTSLERTFEFPTYEHANYFLVRYNNYCEKVNSKPIWSNVYNRVSVTLQCPHVGEITHKEVSIAEYLNMVHDVSHEMTEMLDSDVYSHASIWTSMKGTRNDPDQKTRLGKESLPKLT